MSVALTEDGPPRAPAAVALIVELMFAACGPPRSGDSRPPQAAAAAEPRVSYLTTEEQRALNLPFSEAVRVGDMLYLSGQVGNVPGTLDLAPGGIQPETRQSMQNIQAVLERYGSSLDRVVKCTVMIDDMAEWSAMNEVYIEFFPTHKPARSAIGADGLALGAKVEIECWATFG